MEQMLSDPRRRRLAILGAIAVVLLLFAILALWRQSEQLAPKYAHTPLFPDLPHQARNVAHIHIDAKAGSFDVAFKPNKGWVIASRNDLPASFEQVNRTIVGMANIETLEPKTTRADWLHYLGLDAPPKGDGVLISLADQNGHALAAIIAGKSEDLGEQTGGSGLFVRKPDSTQSWLAKTTLQPKSNVSDWYDKNLLDIDRARIAQTDVTPVGSPAYIVKRDKPKDTEFKLVNVPAGRELADHGAANGVAGAVLNLTFDDAKPAKSSDFSKAARLVTHTFDGLTITVQTIQQGQDYWAMISAEAAPGKAAAQREAQAINAKTSGWAYKLPPFKGQQLMAKLDSLLKPLHPGQAPKTPPASDDSSDE
ncbi:MAG: DUF4340 domain-containing protein [Rhizomicrobium sp.]